ncbi:NAD-P-binding protein [Artomyces pyxidatus]|uniref:NAD-P-binding protein n=1 Tax=Artomyces pyxidatus TaxID=48021 RepID=A0ACB8SRV9_9AGAM|nr:NAD-P-binding protein [Artomyces pyxidatus]
MSADHKIHLLITGATGYIGGAVLQLLLDRPDAHRFSITALVRDETKAKKLAGLGIETVVGSFAGDTLVHLAAASHVVLHTANADDLHAANSILKGLKQRHAQTGAVPIFVHTSGTGVLTDKAAGDHDTDVIYDDANVDQIESLPTTQAHRNVDLQVVAADKEGYVRTFIVLPSTIYGLATGTLVDLGISNPHSQQIPGAIKASIDRGQGGMVGEGKNVWPHVHINEQADMFRIVLEAALTDVNTPHGREGFYFGENGEYRLYDVAKTYTQVLYDLGKSKTPEPTTFTEEETLKYFGGSYLGTNSRARGSRARLLGWKPVKTTDDLLASIRPEVEAIIAQQKGD